MKKQSIKKSIQLLLGLTAVAAFLVGCGEGGGKGSSKKKNDYYGYGAYNCQPGSNQMYNGQYGHNQFGYNNQYGYNNQMGYNQNCNYGGTRQCINNGSFWTDLNGQRVDPFRYGCNMNQHYGQNFGHNSYFQAFQGGSCATYGPQWQLVNMAGQLVCTIPSMWGVNNQFYRQHSTYGVNYVQFYPYSMYNSYNCRARSGRFLIFGYSYFACY